MPPGKAHGDVLQEKDEQYPTGAAYPKKVLIPEIWFG